MAVTRNKQSNNREVIKVESFEILRSHKFDDDTYSFNLKINGITIYSMRMALNKKDEYFIAMPQIKGRDNKYYKNVYFALDDADAEAIMEAVIKTAE